MVWANVTVLLVTFATAPCRPDGAEAGVEPAGGSANGAREWCLSAPPAAGPCVEGPTYPRCIDQHAVDLADQADRLNDEQAIPYRLAAANWILAYQLEPVATRWFLGLTATDDGDRARAALRQARRQLQQARAARQRMAATSQPASPDELAAVTTLGETLDVLADAMQVVLIGASSDGPDVDPGAAAARLALLLEDERSDVAAAARLWRAALFNETGWRDRALALLAHPLAPLSPGGLRFDFYSRLYRCRCIADRGGYAAAEALLLEIDRMCDDWFVEPDTRQTARRATVAVRVHVLQAWCEAQGETPSAEREWCLTTLKQVRTDACENGQPCTVLRMAQAVPLLVTIPAIPGTATERTTTTETPTTTRPATPGSPPATQPFES